MAPIHNYKIIFKSLRSGETYTANIGGGDGQPIQLKGGATPFVTQEDSDEEMFMPLRTQTGTLSIIDDGYGEGTDVETALDWHDLLPTTDTERPVTLTDSQGNVMWQGFMQAIDYSGTLYGNPQERNFPIQCVLMAMSAVDIPVTNGIVNFAKIIRDAFASVPFQFERYVFQGGSDARQWLMKKVMWQNFLNEDSNGSFTAKYNYQQVLQDICQYWGWTCRTYRRQVIFTAIDDSDTEPNAFVLTQTQLDSLASGTDIGRRGSVETFASSLTPGDIFASADNDEIQVRGFSKATVHADCNKASNVMEFAPKVVDDILENAGGYSWTGEDMRGYFSTPLVTQFTTDIMDGRGSDGGGFCRRQVYTSEEAETADTQDMIILPSVDGHPGWVTGSVQIDWKRQMMYNAGRLEINGNVFQGYQIFDAKQTDNWRITMRLGIGQTRARAMWFYYGYDITTGSITYGWRANANSSFQVNIANGRIDGLVAYNIMQLGALQFLSYIPIPDDSAMFGNLYIDILGIEDMNFEIGNLSVGYSRNRVVVDTQGTRGRTMTTERKDRVDYTASNIQKAVAEWDIDNIFASDKNGEMAFGFGLVMNADYTFMQKAKHGSTQQEPEQVVADRVASFWSKARKMLRTQLQSQDIEATPRTLVNINDGTYYPLSISHDWRDDVVELLMVEL